VLRNVLGPIQLDAPRLAEELDVVITACEMRTGTALRFGSRHSGNWRLREIVDPIPVSTAVAASAAYPLLLPALDRSMTFAGPDGARKQRVVLTDGGVFDNLGTSCLEPGRSTAISFNVFPVDYIIACDAGRGFLADRVPLGFYSRVSRAFEATFRKLQDAGRSRLHNAVANREIRGFVMPYLGQQDGRLPWRPADLVTRNQVCDYPTDFAAMDDARIDLLTRRGEQLTRLSIDAYCPEL
jgi:NTE family protein